MFVDEDDVGSVGSVGSVGLNQCLQLPLCVLGFSMNVYILTLLKNTYTTYTDFSKSFIHNRLRQVATYI